MHMDEILFYRPNLHNYKLLKDSYDRNTCADNGVAELLLVFADALELVFLWKKAIQSFSVNKT